MQSHVHIATGYKYMWYSKNKLSQMYLHNHTYLYILYTYMDADTRLPFGISVTI